MIKVGISEVDSISMSISGQSSGVVKGRDGHSPYIGENGTWIRWDDENRTWVDTGVTATGPKGDPGPGATEEDRATLDTADAYFEHTIIAGDKPSTLFNTYLRDNGANISGSANSASVCTVADTSTMPYVLKGSFISLDEDAYSCMAAMYSEPRVSAETLIAGSVQNYSPYRTSYTAPCDGYIYFGFRNKSEAIDNTERMRILNTMTYDVRQYKIDTLSVGSDASDAPVTDVTVNGTSVVSNGVANIPIGGTSVAGVYKVGSAYGTYKVGEYITTSPATEAFIDKRNDGSTVSTYSPLCLSRLDYGVRAALCDGNGPEWTSEQKAAAQERLGIVPTEWNSVFSITTNAEQESIEFDYSEYGDDNSWVMFFSCPATSTTGNLFVKYNGNALGTNKQLGASIVVGFAKLEKVGNRKTYEIYASNSEYYQTPTNSWVWDYSVSSVNKKMSLYSSTKLPVGTKVEIFRTPSISVGADAPEAPVKDVKVNGASVLANGVAEIPLASSTAFGAVKTGCGFAHNSGGAYANIFTKDQFKGGGDYNFVSFGTLKNVLSNPSVMPALIEEEQKAARERLGIFLEDDENAFELVDIWDATEDTTAYTKILGESYKDILIFAELKACAATKNMWVGTSDKGYEFGVVPTAFNTAARNTAVLLSSNGSMITTTFIPQVSQATVFGRSFYTSAATFTGVNLDKADITEINVQSQAGASCPIPAGSKITIYGRKFSASEHIGIAAGSITDVSVNGTSVVSDGVANVPMASPSQFGAIKIYDSWGGYGIVRNADGFPYIARASADEIAERTNFYKPIVPATLDYAVKTSMCDGRVDWTPGEQKAARERIGLEKKFELIETITVGDGVSEINRVSDPNGTPLSLSAITMELNFPAGSWTNFTFDCWFYGGSVGINGYMSASSNASYASRGAFKASRESGVYLMDKYGTTLSYGAFPNGSSDPVAVMRNPKVVLNDAPFDRYAIIARSNVIPAGSVIKVYGIRE